MASFIVTSLQHLLNSWFYPFNPLKMENNISYNKPHNLFQKAHWILNRNLLSTFLSLANNCLRWKVGGGTKNVVASEAAGQPHGPWDGVRSTAGLVLKGLPPKLFHTNNRILQVFNCFTSWYIIDNHQINNNCIYAIPVCFMSVRKHRYQFSI